MKLCKASEGVRKDILELLVIDKRLIVIPSLVGGWTTGHQTYKR